MSETFTKSQYIRAPRPRSERLRKLGGTASAASGQAVIPVTSDISGLLGAYLPKTNVISKGSVSVPVYFDQTGVAQPVTRLDGTLALGDGSVTVGSLLTTVETIDSYFTVVYQIVDGVTRRFLKVREQYAGLYTDGELSAGGLNAGGGGGGGTEVYWNGPVSSGKRALVVGSSAPQDVVTDVVAALGYTPADQTALSSYLKTSDASSIYQTKITPSNKLAWGCIASPTTISGYGITNAYTKTETDTAISTALSGYVTEAWVTDKNYYAPSNCNNTSTPWSCSSLTANGSITLSGGSISDAASATFTRTLRHSITNTLYLLNHAQGAGNTGTAIVMGYAVNQYYAKIAMIYEDENPSFLRPSLAFYTMDSTYEAGSEMERMRIRANGNVGINTPSPSETLHVVGNILATGEVTAGSLSDERFKDNVQDFEDAMGIIRQLRPVTFDWNGLATSYCAWHKGSDFGLIAQEVATVLPSVISPIYQHYMRVDYSKLSALCIAGLQEHDSEIELLKLRITDLENKLSRYES